VEMQEWSKINKDYKYMLNVIDVFSKYAWSVPLKDKKGDTVTEAFKYILKNSNRIPKHIWVDKGKEFYNRNMDQWLKENNINRYSTYGEHKSAVVERFNRTLKEKMWKRFTAENTRNWFDMLDRLLNEYNKTFHSTIGMTPIKCSKLKNHEMKLSRKVVGKPKFKVDDKVRISRIKGTFEKGYLPNWSEAIYLIHEVKQTSPVTYILKDTAGEVLEGSFYENELQITKQEIYRIEKVIRKKNIKGVEHALVKWMGYNDKFNEWIPVKNLYKLEK
jgi:Integrase core domain